MGNLPSPLAAVPLPFVAAGGVSRTGPVARVFRGPSDFSPALAKVVSVSKDVRDAIDVPGAVFHPARGFCGLASGATARSREFLERWNKSQMPFSAAFAAEWEAKDYAQYERLSMGVMYGLGAGLALGGAFQAAGFRPTEGWGRAVEGFVRLVTGNGDSIGGQVALRLGARADARAEPEDPASPDFETLLRLARERAGISADGDSEGHAGAFSLGSLAGVGAGPVLQAGTEFLPFSKLGVAGSFYASAYSNADNLMGAVGAFVSMYRRRRALGIPSGAAFAQAFAEFRSHPFQFANAAFIVAAFAANAGLRASGALPVDQQVLAAVEGAVLNLDTVVASLWTKTRIAKLRAGLVDGVARKPEVDRLWAEVRA